MLRLTVTRASSNICLYNAAPNLLAMCWRVVACMVHDAGLDGVCKLRIAPFMLLHPHEHLCGVLNAVLLMARDNGAAGAFCEGVVTVDRCSQVDKGSDPKQYSPNNIRNRVHASWISSHLMRAVEQRSTAGAREPGSL